ncbi:MAG: hypothetical protein EBS05_14630 [Proteobacteria bacterium]|nr:hypothetical protein [Pseudomonadota bacterium]
MQRTTVLLLVGVTLLVGLTAFVSIIRPVNEPVWDDHPLSYWLQIGYGVGMTHGETDREDADRAVRYMGTNALPFLLRELSTSFSYAEYRIWQLSQKQSLVSYSFLYADERRNRVIGAFRALGKTASPALPQIRF